MRRFDGRSASHRDLLSVQMRIVIALLNFHDLGAIA